MNIDWSKAPEDATHAGNSPYEKGVVTWFKGISDPTSRNYFMNEGSMNAWAISSENLSAWHLIERPKKQEAWDGVCIPHIDSECKVVEGPALWEHSGMSDWIGRNVKVKSTFINNIGQQIASVESDNSECACFIVECLRPIKTAEQLAEEEIQAIRDEIRWQKPQLGPCPVAQLYHKGYRKQ